MKKYRTGQGGRTPTTGVGTVATDLGSSAIVPPAGGVSTRGATTVAEETQTPAASTATVQQGTTVDPAVTQAVAEGVQEVANEYGVDTSTMTQEDEEYLVQSAFTQQDLADLGLSQSYIDYYFGVESAYQGAKESVDSMAQPSNMGFYALQRALQKVSGVGSQDIGTSELFEQAGVPTTMGTLSQSMGQRTSEMDAIYDKYNLSSSQVAGVEIDAYNALLSTYQTLKDDYRYETDYIRDLDMQARSLEDQLALLDAKTAAEKDLMDYENGLTGSSWLDVLTGGTAGSFSNTSFLPAVQTSTNTSLGGAVITGYGSEKWSEGLDIVLDGGSGAEIIMPMGGEVVDVATGHTSGEENSFGNQVKVRFEDGQEVWFSHLNDVLVEKGATFTAGSVVGTQGNTGTTYSLGDGDGTHVDITMPNADNGYYTPEEVASYFGAGQDNSDTVQRMIALKLELGLDDNEMMEYSSLIASGMYDVDGIRNLISGETDVERIKQAAVAIEDMISAGDDPFDVIQAAISDLTDMEVGTRASIIQELHAQGAPLEPLYLADLQYSLEQYIQLNGGMSGGIFQDIVVSIGAGVRNIWNGLTEDRDISDPYSGASSQIDVSDIVTTGQINDFIKMFSETWGEAVPKSRIASDTYSIIKS